MNVAAIDIFAIDPAPAPPTDAEASSAQPFDEALESELVTRGEGEEGEAEPEGRPEDAAAETGAEETSATSAAIGGGDEARRAAPLPLDAALAAETARQAARAADPKQDANEPGADVRDPDAAPRPARESNAASAQPSVDDEVAAAPRDAAARVEAEAPAKDGTARRDVAEAPAKDGTARRDVAEAPEIERDSRAAALAAAGERAQAPARRTPEAPIPIGGDAREGNATTDARAVRAVQESRSEGAEAGPRDAEARSFTAETSQPDVTHARDDARPTAQTLAPDAAPIRPAVSDAPATPLFAPVEAAGAPEAAALRSAPRESLPVPGEALPLHVEWLAQRGGGRARVELHPPHLGRVELSVRVENGAVEITIVAHEPAAQSLALGQRDQLADALATRDLRLANFEVSDGGTSGQRDLPRDGSERGERGEAGDVPLAFDAAARPRETGTITGSVGAGVDVRV